MSQTCDFLVIGAGILGLSVARALKAKYSDARTIVVDKEARVGQHQSGRNSGVLHSGIYYPEASLKARVCVEGAQAMAAYCEERGLPLLRCGKVIVPTNEHDDPQLDILLKRGQANGVTAEMLDRTALRELEPEARSATGRALWVPSTAVIDSESVLQQLVTDLQEQGVIIHWTTEVQGISVEKREARAGKHTFSYGHLFNTAGLHADTVAQACGLAERYAILPFKGLYYRLDPASGLQFNHLIYPVPDLNVPFLGVHVTKKVNGDVYLGPTAIPAFGREQYHGLHGLYWSEATSIVLRLAKHYLEGKQGFRHYAHAEAGRFLKSRFASAASGLVPRIEARHLLSSDKVGIRAQLVDRVKGELVMDFLCEQNAHSTHILNAVSPAFTSAFAFARLLLNGPAAVVNPDYPIKQPL